MATSGTKPEPPLIVIVGPTASGKTGLAIRIAEELSHYKKLQISFAAFSCKLRIFGNIL